MSENCWGDYCGIPRNVFSASPQANDKQQGVSITWAKRGLQKASLTEISWLAHYNDIDMFMSWSTPFITGGLGGFVRSRWQAGRNPKLRTSLLASMLRDDLSSFAVANTHSETYDAQLLQKKTGAVEIHEIIIAKLFQ